MIPIRPLSYREDALEPVMSAESVRFHHDGHYARYVRRINELTQDAFTSARQAYQHAVSRGDTDLRHQAAQAWAHEVFFGTMAPPPYHTSPAAALRAAILSVFGELPDLRETFVQAAASIFGSGWVHLCATPSGLEIQTSQDGWIPPMATLAILDAWEHAYYLDYPDARDDYVRAWFDHLLDWTVVSSRHTACVRAGVGKPALR